MKEFTDLKAIDLSELLKIIEEPKSPFVKGKHWIIKNEIKPVDLFCYLYAKYGEPNGLMTLLRNDDSDNLVQWDWMLKGNLGTISIQGHNFRTEIFLSYNKHIMATLTIEDFIDQIKSDFKNYGKEISNIKKELEKWAEFMNPFKRVQETIHQHFIKLKELQLNISEDKVSNFSDHECLDQLNNLIQKYHFAIGLVYGLRSMLPVMAESFINCLIFILCKKEIKNDSRLYDTVIRQPIDIRVKSLHLNCDYFTSNIDYNNSEECKNFHTLMNERNDLLHGNINIQKQEFGTVYFLKNIAIYDEYKDHWERTIGHLIQSVKFESIHKDHETVIKFIDYVLSNVRPELREEIRNLLDRSYLGFNKKTKRLGILFAPHTAEIQTHK